MLKIQRSAATSSNPGLQQSPRTTHENNATWLARHVIDDPQRTSIVLLGGRSQTAFRLRAAQAQARRDLQPSYWSHVVLLNGPDTFSEVPLERYVGEDFPPLTNGVRHGRFQQYASTKAYPNVALLHLPVPYAAVAAAAARFQVQRTVVDALELTLAWLAFAWGVGRTPNPLHDGLGIPAATFVEYAVGGAGFDLVPGLASRASCPEAIWQSALWWHEQRDGGVEAPQVTGSWTAPHAL